MYIITTKDGSHSLFSEQYDEIYHSGNGAIQESTHVFINSGFQYALRTFQPWPETALKIFEVGFGTGLNALLTYIAALQNDVEIYYETIERYPVPVGVINQLNYSVMLEGDKHRDIYHALHLYPWNEVHDIAPFFKFKKMEDSFLSFEPQSNYFHLIYFDAFAPENQPEMWTLEMMRKIYDALVPNGIMVSYCSKSVFRKTLIEAGFTVEKLPGPPGKREMVRAIKN
jgi:tRNA U34 5-methylaminomethyl-2-thiouridine-forming methyltransferase MnmC